jgi:hypothetical protein
LGDPCHINGGDQVHRGAHDGGTRGIGHRSLRVQGAGTVTAGTIIEATGSKEQGDSENRGQPPLL